MQPPREDCKVLGNLGWIEKKLVRVCVTVSVCVGKRGELQELFSMLYLSSKIIIVYIKIILFGNDRET